MIFKNIKELEKRVFNLELIFQEQKQNKFVPEDSDGIYIDSLKCDCPK